jgi:hypothetical protein
LFWKIIINEAINYYDENFIEKYENEIGYLIYIKLQKELEDSKNNKSEPDNRRNKANVR